MSTLEENLKKVKALYKLEKDWNLYDADPVDKNIVYTVEQILPKLNKQPDEIFPTAANSVQIEYHMDKMYLEIEFGENRIDWLAQLKNPESALDATTDIPGILSYQFEYIPSINKLIEIYSKYDW